MLQYRLVNSAACIVLNMAEGRTNTIHLKDLHKRSSREFRIASGDGS
jgi:hypothetical protein